jgi:hypothetical protein
MIVVQSFYLQMLKLTYCITGGFSAKDTLAFEDSGRSRTSIKSPQPASSDSWKPLDSLLAPGRYGGSREGAKCASGVARVTESMLCERWPTLRALRRHRPDRKCPLVPRAASLSARKCCAGRQPWTTYPVTGSGVAGRLSESRAPRCPTWSKPTPAQ